MLCVKILSLTNKQCHFVFPLPCFLANTWFSWLLLTLKWRVHRKLRKYHRERRRRAQTWRYMVLPEMSLCFFSEIFIAPKKNVLTSLDLRLLQTRPGGSETDRQRYSFITVLFSTSNDLENSLTLQAVFSSGRVGFHLHGRWTARRGRREQRPLPTFSEKLRWPGRRSYGEL